MSGEEVLVLNVQSSCGIISRHEILKWQKKRNNKKCMRKR
jgi:hypothetical protein